MQYLVDIDINICLSVVGQWDWFQCIFEHVWVDFGDDKFTISSWEHKVLVSRDGQMMLSIEVFFASIDQRSERDVGESACIDLAAIIVEGYKTTPILCQ